MKTFGLTGYPLSHSWSADYFNRKFQGLQDHEYRLFPLKTAAEINQLIISEPSLLGLNVTIPHKIAVLPFLTELSPEAGRVGAVNCVKISREAGEIKQKGYNTDVIGFSGSLKPLLGKQHTRALVLGTGGASKAVMFVLDQLGIGYTLVSRNPAQAGIISYGQLNRQILQSHYLVINTSPQGMFPNVSELPEIPYEFLDQRHLLFDLVYNPAETLFLQKGREAGAAVKNGLEMLILQAESSWEIWNQA